MFKEAGFVTSLPRYGNFPGKGLPQLAVCGRSNVGKSSLINCLCRRRALAKTSSVPGKTRLINVFLIDGAFHLIDLPGYGYAKAPLKTVQKWRYLVNDYLRGRQVLKRAFLLIDSRHGTKDVDREIMKKLDAAAVSYRIVLTKTDKIKASDLARVGAATLDELRKHSGAFPLISATSAEKKGGIDDLRDAVLEAVAS